MLMLFVDFLFFIPMFLSLLFFPFLSFFLLSQQLNLFYLISSFFNIRIILSSDIHLFPFLAHHHFAKDFAIRTQPFVKKRKHRPFVCGGKSTLTASKTRISMTTQEDPTDWH